MARIFLALVAFILPWCVQAQMYKCVDERGVTTYSDKPRPGCQGGAVDIRPIPPVSGKTASRPSDVAGQDAEFKRRQIEREQAEAKDKAALDRRCARLRYEQAWLASGGRISYTNAQGQQVFVDDASRDARLVQVKEALRGCP